MFNVKIEYAYAVRKIFALTLKKKSPLFFFHKLNQFHYNIKARNEIWKQ